jgi:GcrA cell cycle regulator
VPTEWGFAGPDRAKDLPRDLLKHWPAPPKPQLPQPPNSRERHVPEFIRPTPIFERTETVKLRCVEIDPRHVSLTDLRIEDCRYPYGGDKEGEAITFCGHPRRQGSSYCAPHFHLTRGPGTASERSAGTVLLRLVEGHVARTRAATVLALSSSRRRVTIASRICVTKFDFPPSTEAIQRGTGKA